MPWVHAGHDFGYEPHGWGPGRPNWDAIKPELQQLRSQGIRVLRWFILAGGVNYPSPIPGVQHPQRANGAFKQAIDYHARRVYLEEKGLAEDAYHWVVEHWLESKDPPKSPEPETRFVWEWTGDPTPLSPAFLDDFIGLCRACKDADLQLLPSMLSFEWFQGLLRKDKGVCSGARGRLIFGPPDSPNTREHVGAFLDAVLVPLLDRTTQEFGSHASAGSLTHPIFAWESINEPDWVVEGGPHLLAKWKQPVPAHKMNLLLAGFRQKVLDAGYDHSIGFKQFNPSWLDSGLRKALIADGPKYWHQGHHYPTIDRAGLADATFDTDRTLDPRPTQFQHCLVGEFPTRRGGNNMDNEPWDDPEVRASEQDDAQYLRGRWSLIRDRGYDGGLLWCARKKPTDTRTQWDANTQRQTRDFALAKPK